MVDEIPYRVEFEPFFFNDQVRYYVSINAGPKDVFAWDTEVELFRAIDDNAGVLLAAWKKPLVKNFLHKIFRKHEKWLIHVWQQ